MHKADVADVTGRAAERIRWAAPYDDIIFKQQKDQKQGQGNSTQKR